MNINRGFSLLELLVVMTVIGLLLAFAAPNLFSLVQARTLSNEGVLLRNQLTYAQQMAVSKNADVEVRFFKWKDESAAEEKELFSAYQLYQYNAEGELTPISSFFRIKAPTAISEEHSTLLDEASGSQSSGSQSSSNLDTIYGFKSPQSGRAKAPTGLLDARVDTDFVSFRFLPNGSTDLPAKSDDRDTWYITLVQGEGEAGANNLAQNYVCLQVNPYNGAVTEFRP